MMQNNRHIDKDMGNCSLDGRIQLEQGDQWKIMSNEFKKIMEMAEIGRVQI